MASKEDKPEIQPGALSIERALRTRGFLTATLYTYLAARPAIQAAPPTAAKNTTAIQACESGSLFVTIATVIVSASIPQIKAAVIQHR
jgi:hypothetical protein